MPRSGLCFWPDCHGVAARLQFLFQRRKHFPVPRLDQHATRALKPIRVTTETRAASGSRLRGAASRSLSNICSRQGPPGNCPQPVSPSFFLSRSSPGPRAASLCLTSTSNKSHARISALGDVRSFVVTVPRSKFVWGARSGRHYSSFKKRRHL